MRWFLSRLPPAWSAFLVLAACVGFLVDLGTVRSTFEDSVNEVLPVVAAFLPLIAYIVAVWAIGIIVAKAVRLGIDWKNDGPSVRKFQALSHDIMECKLDLMSLLTPRPMEYGHENVSRATQFVTELNLLLEQLHELGIRVPIREEVRNINESGDRLIAYLERMRILAQDGRLSHARQDTLWENWKSVKGS